MIYFLAEYCLNSLNGNFFESAEQLIKSKQEHAFYAPFASLYIAIIGSNTFDISIVFSQIMFLYNLFHKIDQKFNLLMNYVFQDQKGHLYNKIFTLSNLFPIIPFAITMSLHLGYISVSNKYKSLLSRILYSIVNHISRLIFKNSLVAFLFSFLMNYILMDVFVKLHQISKLKASSIILSFSGTYFFLKTFQKLSISSKIGLEVFNFDLNNIFEKNVIFSYTIFVLFWMSSYYLQHLLGFCISFFVSKKKRF